jgi:NTP pyrophosphatase (non-canonical NTP hydrolase)
MSPEAVSYRHRKLVRDLAKPGTEIAASMTPDAAHLLHMAVGVAGEAGELLDAVKKHVIYNKPLDTENMVEELGDVEFYMQGIREFMDITRETILEHNIVKLSRRYSEGRYSNQAAQERADKSS